MKGLGEIEAYDGEYFGWDNDIKIFYRGKLIANYNLKGICSSTEVCEKIAKALGKHAEGQSLWRILRGLSRKEIDIAVECIEGVEE